MDDIARATGLLKGSLYYYLDTKEDLLYSVVQDVHEVSHAQLEAARARTDLSATARLLHFVKEQVLYNARNVTRVAVYHHEWHRLEGDRLKEVRAGRQAYNADLMALIDEAKDAGEIPADTDTALSANTILAVICWPYTWYRSTSMPPQRLADFCTDFVSAAMGAKR
jgi:AcrR family transcriptional regulator